MWRGVSCFEEVEPEGCESLGRHGGTANTSPSLPTSLLLRLVQKFRSKLELEETVSSSFILGTLPSVGQTWAETLVGLLEVCSLLLNGKAGEEETEGGEVSPLGNSCVLHMLLLV